MEAFGMVLTAESRSPNVESDQGLFVSIRDIPLSPRPAGPGMPTNFTIHTNEAEENPG